MPSRPSKTADFDATWQSIAAGVTQTLQHPSAFDMKEYMTLYNAVHNFCTGRCTGYSELGQGFAPDKRGKAYLLGKELYERLRRLLEVYLQNFQDQANQCSKETLLAFYLTEWHRYQTAARSNNHLLRFLNRTWVKRELNEGKKNVHDVYTLHMIVWKEVVVDAISAETANALKQVMATCR